MIALKKIIKKKYSVDEGILSIILSNEYLLRENSSLPNEVKRLIIEYIEKLREYAGIEEKEHKYDDIIDFKYILTYKFEKKINTVDK